jgi:hypothetical protein
MILERPCLLFADSALKTGHPCTECAPMLDVVPLQAAQRRNQIVCSVRKPARPRPCFHIGIRGGLLAALDPRDLAGLPALHLCELPASQSGVSAQLA